MGAFSIWHIILVLVVIMLVFGAGSIGGMVLMSLAISLPFSAAASRPMLGRALQMAAGAASLGFGLLYAWWQVTT